MDDGPGPSSRYDKRKGKKYSGHTSDSSCDSPKKSRDTTPIKKQWIDNVDPSIKHVGHRVDLLSMKKEKESESLYERAKKLVKSDDCRPDIKLPTTSEEYYDLEEMLLNPARMESGELTLNVYDEIRNSYNVLPSSHISETNFQKVIGCFSCDVCQEVIQHSIVNKKCGHRFCDQCILVALMRSGNTCPTCRQNLGSKRELQQDPRFDQLIDQVIESRSIVHRMMAENRDHEKDIYFGRFGYIEGERDWNKRYGIIPDTQNKTDKQIKHGKKQTVSWFDKAETGAVPEMVYDKVAVSKLGKTTSEGKLRVLDGLPKDKKKSKNKTNKRSESIMIDGIQIVCLSSDDNEEDSSDESNFDSEESFESDSSEDDSEESDESKDTEDEQPTKEVVRPKAKAIRRKELREAKSKDASKASKDPMKKQTKAAEGPSKSQSNSPKDKVNKTAETSEKQNATKGKKIKASTIDIGLEDSDDSDDSVQEVARVQKTAPAQKPVPARKSLAKETPKKSSTKFAKKEKASTSKRKRRRQSSDDDSMPEIIDGDIPTPSEDSLTSTDDEEERRAGAYDFVFEDHFNFDPRRDGHPEKDKLFNFDWMIDMDAQVNRKYEQDGEFRLRSDDSNSEPDSEESGCPGEELVLRKHIEQKVKQFLRKRSQPVRKEAEDITNDETSETAKKTPSDSGNSSLDSHVDIGKDIKKCIEGLGALSTEDQMFEGFLFRPGASGSERPIIERDPDFKDHDFSSNPTDVYLVYPPIASKKKGDLRIPPKNYRIPSSESDSDKEDGNLTKNKKKAAKEKSPKNKSTDDIAMAAEVPTKSLSLSTVKETSGVSTIEPMEQEPATSAPTASKSPSVEAQPAKSLSAEQATGESSSNPITLTEESAAGPITTTGEVESDDESDIIVVRSKGESTLESRYAKIERIINGGDASTDDLNSLWEEMQNLGLHELSEDELLQMLASTKTSMKNKVFYDSSATNQHHMKPDINIRKHVEKMNMDDITSLTNCQTAHEENKVHRRRLALLNSVVTVASEFNIKLESSDEDDEEEDGNKKKRAPMADDDVVIDGVSEHEEEENDEEDIQEEVPSASDPVAEVQEEPAVAMEAEEQALTGPRVDEIAAILFDDDEPCSSAQAAERDRILNRIEEEQMLIEESLKQKNKAPSEQPEIIDDGVFKRPKTPENIIDRRKGQEKKTRKKSTWKDGVQQKTKKKENDDDEIIVDYHKSRKGVTAYINEDFIGSDKSGESDYDSDIETKLGSLMNEVDADVIKPSIAEYASIEYIKTASPQASANDIPNALTFMARNIDEELDEILATGKKSDVDPDDTKLENFVNNFRKKYAARNPPPPFKSVANLDRKLIDKSMFVRSKYLMDMEPLQMKILVALQKQQIAASCASLSQPVTVTPQEHAEQVALLTNLQNPAILQPLMQNPQFAATLHKAQQQAIRQQQAQQKALLQREMAIRKAEQARVEELARKRIAQEKIDAEAARRAELEKMGIAVEPVQPSTEQAAPIQNERAVDVPPSNEQAGDASTSNEQAVDVPTENERAVDVVMSDEKPKSPSAEANTSAEPLFELDQSMSEPKETILAGNLTHTVENTINDEDEPRSESPNLLEETIDDSMEGCSTSQYEDETIDMSDDLLLVDEDEAKKKCDKDLDREMVNYANRYHRGTMVALNEKGVSKHNAIAQQLREAQELQEMISLHEAGVTKEVANPEEEEEEEKDKEPEFQMDQLELAKSILMQRQGYEPFGESESEEDEEYDIDTGDLLKKTSRVTRQPRQRTNVFIPNIPMKIRRKYIEKKIESERNKLKNRIKTAKLAAIRINVPPRPPPQPQFATPKLPAHKGKHPTVPRTAPKPKKQKMANVQMSIVQPPQPLHQLQGHMGAPTRITAVPNTSAAFQAQQHQQLQQQVHTAMSQVPQSTPIRPDTATPVPVPQQQSHLAQLGQLVHGTNPQANQHAAMQLQNAQLQQIAQAAQAAQAAQVAAMAQARQTPNPAAGPSQADLINAMNMQMAMQRTMTQNQHEEINAIHQILRSRGQFPPTDEKQFLAHFAQAQADYRASVASQPHAQMAALRAAQEAMAREQALMKQVQEQQRLQAAAREVARLKAEAERKAKAKAEAEARRKAEAERARKAKEEAKARELAQAQAQMRAQAAQAAHAAQMAHAAQVAQAHQTFTEIQAVAATGQPLTTEQLQKLQQLAQMPHIVPMQDLEQIKNLLLHHMVMNYRMATPQPPMPMMPGMFPGFGPIATPAPDQFAQFGQQQPEMLRQLQEANLAMNQRRQAEQNQLLQQQMAQAQGIIPPAFNQQQLHMELLQQQLRMNQQLIAQQNARMTPMNVQPVPLRTPAPVATPAPAIPTPMPVAPVAPIQTPQPVQHALPDAASTNVELEIWPSNGFSRKNNLQGPNAAALFYRTTADANLNHVACLIRSRLMTDNISTLWVLRLEDRAVQHFRLDQNLAEAQRFVGRQHVIMFYDDAEAGQTQQTNDYIINKDFQSQRN